MIDLNNIPPNWTTAKLGEVCDNISLNGIKIKQKQYLSSGKFPVIDQGQTLIGGYHNEDKFLVTGEPPFIVFGDHTKVKKYVNFIFIAGSDCIKVLKPHSVFNPNFFYYLLFAVKIPDRGYARHFQFLVKEEIPLPPLPEQHRIVSKLEELFTELDKGIEQLQTAQQQLKVYRQAVLKWAFEADTHKEYLLKDVSVKIQIGPFGTQLHKEDYIECGIPLINPMHIENGKIVTDNSYTISKEKRDSLPNYILQEGDILLGRRGEMGRCALIGDKENGWFCGTGSLFVRPQKEILNSTYLYYFLSSDITKIYLQENAGGTTMANLNLKIVGNVPIRLPNIFEQIQVVHEIESRHSVCDKIEETIADSLQQAEALRLSILKKAFEGKLVPQDPNDEPAERLLERIRAEKKAAEQRNVYRKNTKSNPSSVGAK